MTDVNKTRRARGLAVTLVCGANERSNQSVGEILSGATMSGGHAEVYSPGASVLQFASDLAEHFLSSFEDGLRGHSVTLLAPETEVVETALVIEHCFMHQAPNAQIGIREIAVVTSRAEVLETLLDPIERERSSPGFEDFSAPGTLARRLEFASLIVLTDPIDSVTPRERDRVARFLRNLSPYARVQDLREISKPSGNPVVVQRGLAHRLGASMGWQEQLAGVCAARAERYRTEVFVFRDPRPFHPERLFEAVSTRLVPERVGRIARSRGFVRLATRSDRVGEWSTAGNVLDLDPTAMLSMDPNAPLGQEIAMFGIDLRVDVIEAIFADCLLTWPELEAGPEHWASMHDPFPAWEES